MQELLEKRSKVNLKNNKFELTVNLASQQAAAHQASSSGNSRSASEEKEATKANARLGISLQESMQILDVKAPLNSEEVEKRFKHLFEVNEKTNGGSFYLQSKIYCSKQRIDEELRRQEQTKKED